MKALSVLNSHKHFVVVTVVLQKWNIPNHFDLFAYLFLPSVFIIVNNKSINIKFIKNHNVTFIP